MKPIIILLLLLFINSCHQKNKDVEIYDFEILKKLGRKKEEIVYFNKGDTSIFMGGLSKWGGYSEERLPDPSYYTIYKTFYPNGVLESKGVYIGEELKVGTWLYYDDQGNLIKEVDEDIKFGKIKLDWIIEFLKNEGYENWKKEAPQTLELNFAPVGEMGEYPVWIVIVYHENQQIIYHINGDTGDILKKINRPNYP